MVKKSVGSYTEEVVLLHFGLEHVMTQEDLEKEA